MRVILNQIAHVRVMLTCLRRTAIHGERGARRCRKLAIFKALIDVRGICCIVDTWCRLFVAGRHLCQALLTLYNHLMIEVTIADKTQSLKYWEKTCMCPSVTWFVFHSFGISDTQVKIHKHDRCSWSVCVSFSQSRHTDECSIQYTCPRQYWWNARSVVAVL